MISQLLKIEQQIELKFLMNLRLKKVFWYILEVQF